MGGRRAAMMMAVVIWAAVYAEVCRCSTENTMENVNQNSTEEAMHDATDSFTDSACGKFSQGHVLVSARDAPSAKSYEKEGYGKGGDVKNFASEKADHVLRMATDRVNEAGETMAGAMDYAKDKAANAYDSLKDFTSENGEEGMQMAGDKASDAYDTALDRASEGKEAMEEATEYARSRAGNAYYEAKQKMLLAKDVASDKVGDAKEEMKKAVGHEMEAFDEALNKVGEAYNSAKETMTDQARSTYEAAKERLSKATGDVGTKMRRDNGEL